MAIGFRFLIDSIPDIMLSKTIDVIKIIKAINTIYSCLVLVIMLKFTITSLIDWKGSKNSFRLFKCLIPALSLSFNSNWYFDSYGCLMFK